MKDYAFLIAAALVPIAGMLFHRFIGWLELMAFKHLPDGKLRSALITGWTGTTPKTPEELRAQRENT